MMRFRNYIVAAAAVFALAASAGAQTSADTVGSLSGVEITTSVDRADMFVGDLVNYKLTITYDSTYKLIPPPLGANLGAFDVKDYRPDAETTLPDGRIQSESTFKLSTFTTGDYVIPPVPVMFMTSDSTRKVLLSESVPIKVKSLLENAGDTVDIRPLKAQYEFQRDMTVYYVWGGIAVVLIAGLILLWWYMRRRRQAVVEAVDLRDPWEIAFEKMAVLKEKRYIEEGNFKQFYIELTELAREYLDRMYKVDVLEMTTQEFIDNFAEIELPNNLYSDTVAFLKHADLVKFAKFIPEQRRAEDDYIFTHDLIAMIRNDYEQRQQAEVHINGKTPVEAAVTPGGGAE